MNFLLFFHQFHKKNKTKEKNDSQVSMRNYLGRGKQKLERKIVEKRAEAEKKGFHDIIAIIIIIIIILK